MSDDRPLCQDCQQPSDLGLKCRACYRKWQEYLSRDHERQRRELTELAKFLNKLPQAKRKAIAAAMRGEPTGQALSGFDAETVAAGKRLLAGPFGPQFEMKLQAILSAGHEKGSDGMDPE